MSLFKCLLLASLVSQALPAAHGEAHCPGNVASLTLRLVQGALIVIPIEINHSGPYDFVVDTGAQTTSIEPSLAAELGLKAQGTTGVGGVATYARTAYSYLDLIEAGQHSVPNAIAVIQEMTQLKTADSRIRGILGANFLEHFDLLIDNGRHILCLDESGALASTIKGEHIALAEPRGSQQDLPFTRPMIVAAHLSAGDVAPVLLRLDSGSNAPLLYAVDALVRRRSKGKASILKRVANGVEQSFAVLPPQDIQIGTHSVKQVSFVMPMNSIGAGPTPRDDGLLPTMAFQRVFISRSGGYVALEQWEH
jgi:gag-polyprotein putative aspartyl protease